MSRRKQAKPRTFLKLGETPDDCTDSFRHLENNNEEESETGHAESSDYSSDDKEETNKIMPNNYNLSLTQQPNKQKLKETDKLRPGVTTVENDGILSEHYFTANITKENPSTSPDPGSNKVVSDTLMDPIPENSDKEEFDEFEDYINDEEEEDDDDTQSLDSFYSGVLNGPDIRKLIKSHSFNNVLHTNEVAAWKYLKDVINGLLGKNRSTNYHVSVANMLKSFSKIGVHMSLKIHYLHHHLPYFSKQLSTESDEQGERFHQVAAPFEMRYRGKQSPAAIIAEICWWSKQIFENNGNDDLEERAAGRAVDSPVEIMFDSDSDDTSDCDIDNIVSKPLPLKRAKVTFVN